MKNGVSLRLDKEAQEFIKAYCERTHKSRSRVILEGVKLLVKEEEQLDAIRKSYRELRELDASIASELNSLRVQAYQEYRSLELKNIELRQEVAMAELKLKRGKYRKRLEELENVPY